ncbi:leucyl aminopeptidase family protein [Methyloceanibacter sp.]|uniref:leucyl aminopeptidase family protein n=1 Tax=Methyloceanibacter sp. TaxID=1965321 RepID=UPI002D2DDC95|nr:leucyl aminopeptidase family protein [Methyloceanibacter sp.]HZP10078.1 leucyl aminopeptidase family protein [Methyloceanibacter sp.]
MTTKIATLETIAAALDDRLLDAGAGGLPIRLIASEDDPALEALSEAERSWVEAQGWKPKEGSVLLLPGGVRGVSGVLLGTGDADWASRTPLLTGVLAGALPEGDYTFASPLPDPGLAALGFLAGLYRFTRYKTCDEGKTKRLVLPEGANKEEVLALAAALYFGRDLINTPANDLGPAELETAARELANAYGGSIKVIEGSSLLSDNFPMIHAVGRASDRAPRLIDLRFGSEHAPKVTIVGKGICFDTGGLDIKPSSAMGLMKKDMGGAATALAFALLAMRTKLPIRLRVLIPAAENSISGNAFRPGDVLTSRNGMTVEIGNTDAEGRLVLADAISFADEEAPDYLITIATLTGAARVALGPDLPPLYTDDDGFAAGLLSSGSAVGDPLWRMPFWAPYDKMLKSSIADVNHIAEGSFAGSVIAALFLKRFVKQAKRFAHLDIFAWVPREQPGRPQGGEPQGARALFHFFRQELGRA